MSGEDGRRNGDRPHYDRPGRAINETRRGGRGADGSKGRDASRPAGMGGRRGQPGQAHTGPRREVPGRGHGFGRSGNGAPRGGIRPVTQSPRLAALRALQDVVRSDAYAAQALNRQLETMRLTPEDRRLAASIFYFAVENRLYIETMLSTFMDAKPEPVVNDILHVAAAQILFMDRVPDHAIVDEAVKQVRAARREGLTGLVNAVLRSLIRAREAGTLALPDRDSEPERWLSVRYSLAPAIARRLIAAYGLEEAEAIASHTGAGRSLTVRPNRLRMDGPAFETWLDGQGFAWHPGAVADAYILEDAGNPWNSEGYRQGLFSIQGQSAMLAAQAVDAKPGMRILDACAAPGGKTCLMAERMGGAGRVYAWDVHEHRVALIRAAAQRLGLDNVRATVYDARQPMESLKFTMDAVLVDAPCSGLGVIAEKPDIKYRIDEAALNALPELQSAILNACAEAVKVGGLLVYATCTILPEENEAQVRAFLEKHPEFEPDVRDHWLPEALKPRFRDGMIQLLPHRDGLEGFFIARMRRKGV